MAKLFTSDSHFGLPPSTTNAASIVQTVTSTLTHGWLGCTGGVFAGDVLANWKQQREVPDWKDHVHNVAGPLIDLIRAREFIVVAGNCEHQPEMNFLGMGQLPYVWYDEESGVLVTHGHIAEPRSATELVRNLPPALAQSWHPVRRAIEGVFGTRHEVAFDTEGIVRRLRQAVEGDPELQAVLEKNDTEHHQASTNLYRSLAGIAGIIPSFRRQFDALVRLSLDDYYIRMLIHAVRELIDEHVIPAPKTILFGHTHRAFIKSKAQLQSTLDMGPGWLPDYVVNDGTTVQLPSKSGGTNRSHFVLVDDGVPTLYETTNAPIIERINVGGKPESTIIDTTFF